MADFIAVLLVEVFGRTRWLLSLRGFIIGFDFFNQPFDRADHNKQNQQNDLAVDIGHGLKNDGLLGEPRADALTPLFGSLLVITSDRIAHLGICGYVLILHKIHDAEIATTECFRHSKWNF